MTHHTTGRRLQTATTIDALVTQGLVSEPDRTDLDAVAERYAVAVPAAMAALIEGAGDTDPIALQIVPSNKELTTTPEERADPIGDFAHNPVPGVVHRYPDRVLLKVHSACAVYCRFCFRREMVGPGGDYMSDTDINAALSYIRAHTEIWEVILTGGDPLVLSPKRLTSILHALDAIDHVQIVRVHTRLPVAAPERITDELVDVFTQRRATVYVAVHTNHAKELSVAAVAACERLTKAGIPLVGQSVLLKGVNDNADTLEALFRAMVKARIKPYYLNHPDLAPGTSHFRVSFDTGQRLMKDLRGRISGLCLPTYILDIPGGYGKVPVGPTYLQLAGDGTAVVEDINSTRHAYPPENSI
ncbi:MAG: lysine-2,3-aminomutase-like protein [Rhodospirillaceae bacterium]|jgi:lysine 2,3-aminomutase